MAKFEAKSSVDGDDVVIRVIGAAAAVRSGLTYRTKKSAPVFNAKASMPVRRLPGEKIAAPADILINGYVPVDRLSELVWSGLPEKKDNSDDKKPGQNVTELPME